MPGTTIFYVSYAVLWGLVVFQTLVILELVRRTGQGGGHSKRDGDVNRPEMLETGTRAPDFEAPDLFTALTVSSAAFLGRPTLLLFALPNCPACKTSAGEVESMRQRVDARLVVLCQGDASQCREFTATYYADATSLLDEKGAIGGLFKVSGAPTAVVLDADWRVLRYGFLQGSSEADLVAVSSPPQTDGRSQ